MVDKCRGRRATLLQLHALDTALIDPAARQRLSGDRDSLITFTVVRIDPALNRAVDRALGDSLLAMGADGTVQLAEAGNVALREIRARRALAPERALLSEIDGKLTQRSVRLATGVAS